MSCSWEGQQCRCISSKLAWHRPTAPIPSVTASFSSRLHTFFNIFFWSHHHIHVSPYKALSVIIQSPPWRRLASWKCSWTWSVQKRKTAIIADSNDECARELLRERSRRHPSTTEACFVSRRVLCLETGGWHVRTHSDVFACIALPSRT